MALRSESPWRARRRRLPGQTQAKGESSATRVPARRPPGGRPSTHPARGSREGTEGPIPRNQFSRQGLFRDVRAGRQERPRLVGASLPEVRMAVPCEKLAKGCGGNVSVRGVGEERRRVRWVCGGRGRVRLGGQRGGRTPDQWAAQARGAGGGEGPGGEGGGGGSPRLGRESHSPAKLARDKGLDHLNATHN